MNMKRYKAPAPLETTGKPLKARTVVLTVHVPREVGEKVVKLFDAWVRAVKVEVDPKATQATREHLKAHKPGIKLGLSVTQKVIQALDGTPEKHHEDGLVSIYKRKKNFIATWCIINAIDDVSVPGLVQAFPGVRPSLSLVSLLAFNIGLVRFPREIAPPLPEAKAQKAEREADRIVEALVGKSAAAQKAAQNWPKPRRRDLARQLNEKAKAQTDKSQKAALKELARLVEYGPAEVLEQLKVNIANQVDE